MSESEEIEIEEAKAPGWRDAWTLGALVCAIGLVWFLHATNVDLLTSDSGLNKAQSDTKTIYLAAQQYRMTKRRIPTIEELTTPDAKGRAYLESLSDDPWGQPYVIRKTDGRRFEVVSFGEDLKEGTEDDVVYPSTDSQEG